MAKSSDQVLKQAGVFCQHTKLRGESQADISEIKVPNIKVYLILHVRQASSKTQKNTSENPKQLSAQLAVLE